jgi:uncharacterized protein
MLSFELSSMPQSSSHYDETVMTDPAPISRVPQVEQPSPALLTYYLLTAILTLPGFFIVFPILWIRFKTLKYELQDSGIKMRVGFLFRKEVIVAYRRIQDIHVSRDILQRWLGISSVSIQTASGNAAPEIVVEGVIDPDLLRDWLYERMRGAKSPGMESTGANQASLLPDQVDDEVTSLLRGIRDNLAELVQKSNRQNPSSQDARHVGRPLSQGGLGHQDAESGGSP